MPATPPTMFRLSAADRARLQELGRLHGTPGFPLSMADTIRRLIWMPHPAENGKTARTKRT